VKIIVNGEEREYPRETTLQAVIEDLGIQVKVMAAAVNMQVVKQDQWLAHQLKERDRVELLHFVGGG
jgi:sulfur carrier protein